MANPGGLRVAFDIATRPTLMEKIEVENGRVAEIMEEIRKLCALNDVAEIFVDATRFQSVLAPATILTTDKAIKERLAVAKQLESLFKRCRESARSGFTKLDEYEERESAILAQKIIKYDGGKERPVVKDLSSKEQAKKSSLELAVMQAACARGKGALETVHEQCKLSSEGTSTFTAKAIEEAVRAFKLPYGKPAGSRPVAGGGLKGPVLSQSFASGMIGKAPVSCPVAGSLVKKPMAGHSVKCGRVAKPKRDRSSSVFLLSATGNKKRIEERQKAREAKEDSLR
ncbi:unnamed protein product [Zymoseptoria tritici ST99CH_1E4]|uniref:Uncharacterized protein n=1 Tax=Zymoseptoria tritici ST99CH_1E4 TaxID=1276532 RepID=A0A2H1FKN3_ZYMTR|nr:unnamed protein product [Zymoseptoria tritici ST99CH_1E4]